MSFKTNLRRLLSFHHETAREAALLLGISEHTVSAWLTGKRMPGRDGLLRLADTYDVDTRLLMGDPIEFARSLADPERIARAEANIAKASGPSAPVVRLVRKKRKT